MNRIKAFGVLLAFVVLGAAAPLAAKTDEPPVLSGTEATIAPLKDENGLYHQSWSAESFLDLREDLENANAEGKRLVVVFEQRGCIYCRKFHEKVLAIKQVNDFVRNNFVMIQLNLWGDREVTDFDGKVMSEKKLARRWGIMNTPTAVFLTDDLSGKDGKPGRDLTVVPMFYPGAFGPYTTYDMFVWVRIKGYERDEPFQKFHIRRLKAAGLF